MAIEDPKLLENVGCTSVRDMASEQLCRGTRDWSWCMTDIKKHLSKAKLFMTSTVSEEVSGMTVTVTKLLE